MTSLSTSTGKQLPLPEPICHNQREGFEMVRQTGHIKQVIKCEVGRHVYCMGFCCELYEGKG